MKTEHEDEHDYELEDAGDALFHHDDSLFHPVTFDRRAQSGQGFLRRLETQAK